MIASINAQVSNVCNYAMSETNFTAEGGVPSRAVLLSPVEIPLPKEEVLVADATSGVVVGIFERLGIWEIHF